MYPRRCRRPRGHPGGRRALYWTHHPGRPGGLLDYGRPSAVELLVLVDRGHRELPIQADYVGRTVNTSRQEHVDVLLAERDGQDAVSLIAPGD